MDRKITAVLNGVVMVLTIIELRENLWSATTILDKEPYEARSSTAEMAEQALLYVLSNEILPTA